MMQIITKWPVTDYVYMHPHNVIIMRLYFDWSNQIDVITLIIVATIIRVKRALF